MLTLQDFRIKTSYLAKIRTVNAIPKNPVNTRWAYIRTRDKFDEPIFDEEVIYVVGAYIWEKNTSICNPLNLLFFLFFQHTVRISAFFTSYKLRNMFKVNDKVKNKDTVDVVLTSL